MQAGGCGFKLFCALIVTGFLCPYNKEHGSPIRDAAKGVIWRDMTGELTWQ